MVGVELEDLNSDFKAKDSGDDGVELMGAGYGCTFDFF